MQDAVAQKLAGAFRRLGWIGVWVQALLAVIPLLMFAYVVLARAAGTRVAMTLADYLALLGLAVLAFTTYLSYRYTRLAAQIADPARRPSDTALTRVLWVGLWASCLGLTLSLMMLIGEVARLLLLVLSTPQAGVPVIQTQTESRTAWVAAIDVVRLLADVCTLAGEMLILGFTLWLLFRLTALARGDQGATTPASF